MSTPVERSLTLPYAKLSPYVRRSPVDILLSLKTYVAEILGDDWEVRYSEDEGTFARPGALVVATTPASLSGPQRSFMGDFIQGFAIYGYPTLGATAMESKLAALAVEDTLTEALRFGAGAGAAMRVPLYSFDGLSPIDVGVERNAQDYATVSDLSVGNQQDPNDRTLWTVVCEIRLSWSRMAPVTSSGNVVQAVTAKP